MSLAADIESEEKRHGDGKVRELLDIIAEEVSDVDRAANKRTYLVVKRRTDMDGNEESGPEGAPDEAGDSTAEKKAE